MTREAMSMENVVKKIPLDGRNAAMNPARELTALNPGWYEGFASPQTIGALTLQELTMQESTISEEIAGADFAGVDNDGVINSKFKL